MKIVLLAPKKRSLYMSNLPADIVLEFKYCRFPKATNGYVHMIFTMGCTVFL